MSVTTAGAKLSTPGLRRLSVTRHRAGCPAERTEAYPATTPRGARIEVVRCIDCGNSDLTTTPTSEED